jgi:hypothetical protein
VLRERWTILHALIHADKNADGAIATMMREQQHVLMAALQHPSPEVRLAALRCAAALVSAATFPHTDRLGFADVLVRCLRDMRVEAQAAAGPSLDRSRLDGRHASNDRPAKSNMASRSAPWQRSGASMRVKIAGQEEHKARRRS